MGASKLTRHGDTIIEGRFVFRAKQPEHLTGVRSKHERIRVRPCKVFGPGRERVQSVSIDHARRRGALDDSTNNPAFSFIVGSQPWTNRPDRSFTCQLKKVLDSLVA